MKTNVLITIGCLGLAAQSAIAQESVGCFAEGLAYGHRNGSLIADRIERRTIETEGCVALTDYQHALRAVLHAVRVPGGRSSNYTAGFYQGYLNAVKESLQTSRAGCQAVIYENGADAGSLLGDFFCQVAANDAQVLDQLDFGPVYSGWAATDLTKTECADAFEVTTAECAIGLGDLKAQTKVKVCELQL